MGDKVMNPIKYFILIAVIMFVGGVCFAENEGENFIGPKIEVVNEGPNVLTSVFNPDIDLSDEIREDIAFYTRKLQSRDLELDAFILEKLSDNVLLANEMKEINDRVNSAANLNDEAKDKLGNYYWKMDFKVIQRIDFKKSLFNPYFSPLFKERDKNNQLKDSLYKLTGKRVIIEEHFNKTALMWNILIFCLSFGLFIIGILDERADFLAPIGFIVGVVSLIFLITGLCGG
jgi:hypothetical protein